MIIGKPLFMGRKEADQLVQIIRVLGTPAPHQLKAMNPDYPACEFQVVQRLSWQKALRKRTPPQMDELMDDLLRYDPKDRVHPLRACLYSLFSELRCPASGNAREDLVDFSEEELRSLMQNERQQLLIR